MASEKDPFAGIIKEFLDGSCKETPAVAQPEKIRASHESKDRPNFLSGVGDYIRFLYEDFFPAGKRQRAEGVQREEVERQAELRQREFRRYLHRLEMLRSAQRFDAAHDLLSFLQQEYPEREDELRHEAMELHEDRLGVEKSKLNTEIKEEMIRICDERDGIALATLKSHIEQMLETLGPQIVELENEHDMLVAYDIHRQQSSRRFELEERIRITMELREFWDGMLKKVFSLEKYLRQPPNEVLRSMLHSEIWLR